MQKFTDNNITLIEDVHRYELKDDPDFEFTSCTTFAKYFFEPFDKIGVANRLTATHPKYTEMTPQELVGQWDNIASMGTFVHNEVEDFINDNKKPTHPKSKIAAGWIRENLIKKDRYDLFSEVIVYSKELALAGSIDLLLYDKLEKVYKIVDWKTNRKIDFQSFNNKMGHHKATNNMMDCNYSHYSIQLSLYRYILETCYGLTVAGTAISHITKSDLHFYKTEYHKNEIEEMLKADRLSLKKRTEESMTTEYAA